MTLSRISTIWIFSCDVIPLRSIGYIVSCVFHFHRVLLCFHYMCTPVNHVLSCSRSPHVYYLVHPIWASM
ncbi:hypothetical protein M6B38_402280 [Iris pallida]|uniref:Uncharacterized protein n=1 Tax=Iris pallida TaxID=29817 RepID=A0AAX6FSQ9_IRIPA|nr:hypothetical protein M6B38_402280 [Iris pallida]